MNLPLTYLFVPGNRPERFDKAFGAGAGAVIVDLEDAVAPPDKAQARANIVDWSSAHRAVLDRVVVRINDASTEWFAGDLDCIRQCGIRSVMLPKAESGEQVAAVLRVLPGDGTVLPIIESARGIKPADVSEVAKKARIAEYREFDGIRFLAQIGVEPAKGDYRAKNFLAQIITPERKEWQPVAQAAQSTPAAAARPSNVIEKPARAQSSR